MVKVQVDGLEFPIDPPQSAILHLGAILQNEYFNPDEGGSNVGSESNGDHRQLEQELR